MDIGKEIGLGFRVQSVGLREIRKRRVTKSRKSRLLRITGKDLFVVVCSFE